MRQKGWTIIELLIVFAICGVVVAMLAQGCAGGVSDGDRVGELVKISRKGLVVKTWECQLKVSEGSTDNLGLWEFTIPSDGLAKSSQDHLGKKVRVTYYQRLLVMPWEADTSYFAQAISPVAK